MIPPEQAEHENEEIEEEEEEEQDGETSVPTTLKPGRGSDTEIEIKAVVPADIFQRYDVYSYRHAAAILAGSFKAEWAEVLGALRAFRINCHDIGLPGGNESTITKKFAKYLRDHSWWETKMRREETLKLQQYQEIISADYHVVEKKPLPLLATPMDNTLDVHKIDFVKGSIAFDFEWNSKDQTYDRDLFALRLFHECQVISVGVLVTRSDKLSAVFDAVPLLDKAGHKKKNKKGKTIMSRRKYGASTTWIGKLLPRLNSGRHGGCPVLVFAIKPTVIEDWPGNTAAAK